MNLFATLLPGLRSLRAPLAAGYLWLLALWLVYSNDSPDRHDADSVVDRLLELEGVATEFGVAIAVSFVAYLIGSLTEWGTTAVLRTFVSKRFAWLEYWARDNAMLKLSDDKSIDKMVVRAHLENQKFGRRWRRLEFAGAKTTLMVEHPLLYNEYDRLTAEVNSGVPSPYRSLGLSQFWPQSLTVPSLLHSLGWPL